MPNTPGTNTGHGHVWERPDGVKARCGGPGICQECTADVAMVAARGKALGDASESLVLAVETLSRAVADLARATQRCGQGSVAGAASRVRNAQSIMADAQSLIMRAAIELEAAGAGK